MTPAHSSSTERLEIEASAPARARREIVIRAPLATVWRLLTEINGWSQWNPAVSRSCLHGSLEKMLTHLQAAAEEEPRQ